MAGLPEAIATEVELDALLTEPTEEVERALAALQWRRSLRGLAQQCPAGLQPLRLPGGASGADAAVGRPLGDAGRSNLG